MKPISQRVFAVALAGVLATSALAGCNPGPTTTEAVLQTYEQAQNRDNYHSVSIVTLGSEDGDQFKLQTETDVAGDASHSTTTADAFGVNSSTEAYVTKADDGYVSYQSVDVVGNKIWTKTKTTAVSNVGALTASDVLADAEFAKTDTGYTLTVPAEKVFSALTGSDVTYEGLKELAGEGLADALAASKAVYTFDSNCLLTSISCPVTYEVTDDKGEVTAVTNLTFDFTLSNYGAVEADSLAIPENVTTDAIDIDELQANITEFGNSVADALGQFADGISDFANSLMSDGSATVDFEVTTDETTDGTSETTTGETTETTDGATQTTGAAQTTTEGEAATA